MEAATAAAVDWCPWPIAHGGGVATAMAHGGGGSVDVGGGGDGTVRAQRHPLRQRA